MRASSCCPLALLLFAGALLAAGCGSGEASAPAAAAPALETRADSLAMQMYEAHGGPQVWADVPALAFSFAVGHDSSGGPATRQEVARHWWRRSDGAYRVEWSAGPDSTYTATFNVDDVKAFSQTPPSGRALLNGARLDSAAEKNVLRRARTRFSNDTYWLLAPLKLFDEGVSRSIAASSTADSIMSGFSSPSRTAGSGPVLHLSFGRVGITPEDQYWLAPDSTGRLGRWAFALQGMGPEQPPGLFWWMGYETFSTPAGPLTLSTRKENARGPRVIYTDDIRTPATLPDSLFSIGEGE